MTDKAVPSRLVQAAITALAAIAASKKAAAATVATSATAASLSAMAGSDPLPWVIGCVGGLVVIIKFPASSRANGVANAVISVFLAGLGSEFFAQLIGRQLSMDVSRYFVALALSMLWPLSLPVAQAAWPALKEKMSKKISGA